MFGSAHPVAFHLLRNANLLRLWVFTDARCGLAPMDLGLVRGDHVAMGVAVTRTAVRALALAAGADVYWVSKQLGHTNIQTTLKHYARFLPAVDERNLRLLDNFSSAAA
jgi:integrase